MAMAFSHGPVALNTMVNIHRLICSSKKRWRFINNNNNEHVQKGTWVGDKKSGTGKFMYASGDQYDGIFFFSFLKPWNRQQIKLNIYKNPRPLERRHAALGGGENE